MSIIACTAWVPRGAAKENPEKVELTKEDMALLLKNTKLDLQFEEDKEAELDEADGDWVDDDGEEDDDEEDGEGEDEEGEEGDEEEEPAAIKIDEKKAQSLAKARAMAKSVLDTHSAPSDPSLAEYHLDDYDNEDSTMTLGERLAGLALFASNADDPYVEKDADVESIEDFAVKPTDNLIVVGQSDDDCSRLDVYGYDETVNDLFIHHDIVLSSYPLCIEWLSYDPESEEPGNLVAVGGMSTQIEVWDVDIIDAVEPVFTLGQKRRERKTKGGDGHSAEVLGLAWNVLQPTVLASASVDKTVKLWDLSSGSCVRTYTHHKDKVQNVKWNPSEAAILLTGSFDKTTAVFDTRSPQAVARWKFKADVECAIWNHFDPSTFLVSTEDGFVYLCDTKNPGSTVFSLHAHSDGVPGLALSNHIPGCLATGSPDGSVKIWDIAQNRPYHVITRELSLGSIYTVAFSVDSPFVLSVGGEKNGLRVLDLSDMTSVVNRFSDREHLPIRVPVVKEPKSERWHERNKAKQHGNDDDDDEGDVAAVDDDDEEGESWEDIVQELNEVPGHVRSQSQYHQGQANQQRGDAGRTKKDFKSKHF